MPSFVTEPTFKKNRIMKMIDTTQDNRSLRFFMVGSFSFFNEQWMKEKLATKSNSKK